MNNKKVMKHMKTEKTILFEVFKQDGKIWTNYPCENDVQQYELLGFLECYVTYLRKSLEKELQEYE